MGPVEAPVPVQWIPQLVSYLIEKILDLDLGLSQCEGAESPSTLSLQYLSYVHINQKLQLKPSLLLFKDMKSFSYAVVVLVGTSTSTSISASQSSSSSSPTSPTPKSCTGNTPNWQDSYGDGCEWYEVNDTPGCPQHTQDYDGGMGVANDNCCYCEGTGVSHSENLKTILFI